MMRLFGLMVLLIGNLLATGIAAEERRSVRDFGAVGDGVADDTAAIQRAVDAKIGDVWLPRGTYRISQPVVVVLDRVGPTSLIGGGTARLLMTGPGPAVRVIGTHDGTADPHTVKPEVWQRQRSPRIEGIEIVGAHEAACGIEAIGTMQLIVSRTVVRKTLHAIHLTGRNRNVIVSDCHLYENRGVGIYLDDVNLHQINVTGSHISYNAGGGIVVRAGNVRNLQVTGCDLEGNHSADGPATANILIDGRGGTAGTAEVAVTGCTIQHTHKAPDSANIRFIGTDAADRRWGHLTITGNVMSDVRVNVDLQKVRGACITGNTFWKGVQHDLRAVDCTNLVIGPNAMDRNPQYQDQQSANGGVLLERCRDMTISGLHVSGVRRAPGGLVLRECRAANITGCTLLECENTAIALLDTHDTRVSNCLIRNQSPGEDGWKPITVIGGEGNDVTDNTVIDRREKAAAGDETS